MKIDNQKTNDNHNEELIHGFRLNRHVSANKLYNRFNDVLFSTSSENWNNCMTGKPCKRINWHESTVLCAVFVFHLGQHTFKDKPEWKKAEKIFQKKHLRQAYNRSKIKRFPESDFISIVFKSSLWL